MALELKWNQPSSLDTEQTVLLWGERTPHTLKQMLKINLFLSKFHNSGIMEDALSHLYDPCQQPSLLRRS